MDCRVGAISDTEKNVHCLMPKSIWVAKRWQAYENMEGPRPARPFLRLQTPWRCVSLLVAVWLTLGGAGIGAGPHPGRDHDDRSAQPGRGRGRRPGRGDQSRSGEHGCRGISAEAAGCPAPEECAHGGARRARLRSVARSPAGAGRQSRDQPRRPRLCRCLVWLSPCWNCAA